MQPMNWKRIRLNLWKCGEYTIVGSGSASEGYLYAASCDPRARLADAGYITSAVDVVDLGTHTSADQARMACEAHRDQQRVKR